MTPDLSGWVERRDSYVHHVIGNASAICSHSPSDAIVAALEAVPRHSFVNRFWLVTHNQAHGEPELTEYQVGRDSPNGDVLDVVYSDQVLVTRRDKRGQPISSASQPSLVAAMLDLLDLEPGMRVLEIGAGTGYNAALLAEVVGDPKLVTTIDIDPVVAEQARISLVSAGFADIHVELGDGMDGVAEQAPFDRVIATVGCPDISWGWVGQMTSGAKLLVPLRHGGAGRTPLTLFTKSGAGVVEGQIKTWSGFVGLQGGHGDAPWPTSPAAPRGEPDFTFELPVIFTEVISDRELFDSRKPSWWDFGYFLAIDDHRTYFGWELSMTDPSGSSLIVESDHVAVFGTVRDLSAAFEASYERWEDLGRPKATDWRIRMSPQPAPCTGNLQARRSVNQGEENQPHKPGDGEWLLERPYSRQLFSLD